MRSIGRSVRSVRSVCVKESKISVNKIFVLFVRFVFKKNSDLWFILVEHEIIVFEHEIRRRPTDRREVIKRIKRIIYCTRIARITLTRIFYNEIFEHESHELNEYFIAHGSHGSHGSLPAAILDYGILRFVMRHKK